MRSLSTRNRNDVHVDISNYTTYTCKGSRCTKISHVVVVYNSAITWWCKHLKRFNAKISFDKQKKILVKILKFMHMVQKIYNLKFCDF